MNTRNSLAFTLIELLIVVAIIAILAAIAVPNFLEAQTRSKVSRVMSDMRTLSTGLETYSVDYNRYPVGISEGERLGWWVRTQITDKMEIMWKQLSTPVAYMTSFPTDPFTSAGGAIAEGGVYRPYRGYWYWNYQEEVSSEAQIAGNGYLYVIRSWGPIKEGRSPWEYEILRNELAVNIYDSTNGTVSWGFIMRTNKGFYQGPS